MRSIFSNTNVKFLLFAVGLCICLGLFGCSPQKRLARKVKRVERYAQKTNQKIVDTITIIDYDTIQQIKIDTFTVINNDVSGVDTILSKFQDRLDSVTRIQLGNEIKYYVTNRQVLEDTLNYFNEDSIHVQVWQSERGIEVRVNRPQQIKPEVIRVPVEKILVTESKWWTKGVFALLAVLVVVFIAFLKVSHRKT